MSVHDDFAGVALAHLLRGRDLEDIRDEDKRRAAIVEVADLAHQIAQAMVSMSCQWHGHDPVAVVDVIDRDAWYLCRRCGCHATADDYETRESLASVATRNGFTLPKSKAET